MSAADILKRVQQDGRTALTEAESKELFTSIGIAVPDHAVVHSPDEAVVEAERIGYPIVAKVSSPAVQHKTEWAGGAGVQIGVANESAVREAASNILEAAAAEDIDAGVLIEEMVDTGDGTELIVGGIRDRAFGPAVLVGLGGVFTEIFEDTSHRLAPLSEAEALDAITDLRAIELLRGYRSSPPADLNALASTVQAVGDLVHEHESIAEVDVNPVLAQESGVKALDALVTLSE